MSRRAIRTGTAMLLTVGLSNCLLVGSDAAAQTAGTSQGGRPALVKAPGAEALGAMNKLLVVVQPAGTIHGQIVEDALAAEMMTDGLTVVSREKRQSAELKLLEEAAEEAESAGQEEPEAAAGVEEESKADAEKENKEDMGLLGTAKATGADAIVSVTVLTDAVQHNVYDEQLGRVTQVKSEQVVLAVSCTVVRVSDGALLAAGCTDYSDAPTTFVPAARSLGASLRELLR